MINGWKSYIMLPPSPNEGDVFYLLYDGVSEQVGALRACWLNSMGMVIGYDSEKNLAITAETNKIKGWMTESEYLENKDYLEKEIFS